MPIIEYKYNIKSIFVEIHNGVCNFWKLESNRKTKLSFIYIIFKITLSKVGMKNYFRSIKRKNM